MGYFTIPPFLVFNDMDEETKEVKNKFATQKGELDGDELVDLITNNAERYAEWRLSKQPGKAAILKRNRLEAFDTGAFQNALNDVTKAIMEGKLSRGAGNLYTHADGIVWDDTYHKAALDLVDRSIKKLAKQDASVQELKTALGNNRLLNLINNTIYGGNFKGDESDYKIWKDNPDAINMLANVINKEIEDITTHDYDYSNSPYKDKEEYLGRLLKLSNDIKDGVVDKTDLQNWMAVGGDGKFFASVTGLTLPETKKENPYETAWNQKAEQMKLAGISDEEIAAAKADFLKAEQDKLMPNRDKNAYNKAFNDFRKQHWTAQDSQTLDFSKINKNSKLFQLPSIEGGEAFSVTWLKNSGNAKRAENLYNSIVSGKYDRSKSVGNMSEFSDDDIIKLWMDIQFDDEDLKKNFAKIGNTNSYYIKNTLDLNTGTAVVYNRTNNSFQRLSVNSPKQRSMLKKMLIEEYKKTKGTDSNDDWDIYGVQSNRDGGKLNSLIQLRNVRKAQTGAEIVLANEKRQSKLYKDIVSKEAIMRYGDDSEESITKTKKGYKKAFDLKDDMSMNVADGARLASTAIDLASILMSYSVAGMPVAGIMQLGSTGLDLFADLNDDSMSLMDTGKNLLYNIGLGAATTVGAGAVAKLGKIGKTFAKLAPVALASFGYSSLSQSKDFKSAIDKIKKDPTVILPTSDELTSNELKAITSAVKIIAGGHHATKSAAGQWGVASGKNNKVARVAGKWGNNAWRGDSKQAYLRAVNEGGFKLGAIVLPNHDGKVEIGGIRVNKTTAKEMQKAFKAESGKKNATAESIRNAVLDAYRKSDEGKAAIKSNNGFTPEKFSFKDMSELDDAIKVVMAGENSTINGVKFNSAKEFVVGDQTVKGSDLPTVFKNIYNEAADKASGDATAKHKAGLDALNEVFVKLFNVEPTETGMPNFDLSGIKNSGGIWDIGKFFRKLDIVDDSPGVFARIKNKVNPKRYNMFDPNTEEGRANLELLYDIRRKNSPTRKLSSSLEYNSGLGFKRSKLDYRQSKYYNGDRVSEEVKDWKKRTKNSTEETPMPILEALDEEYPMNIYEAFVEETPQPTSNPISFAVNQRLAAPLKPRRIQVNGSAISVPEEVKIATINLNRAETARLAAKLIYQQHIDEAIKSVSAPWRRRTVAELLYERLPKQSQKGNSAIAQHGQTQPISSPNHAQLNILASDAEMKNMNKAQLTNIVNSVRNLKGFENASDEQIVRSLILGKRWSGASSYKDYIKSLVANANGYTKITDAKAIKLLHKRGYVPKNAKNIYKNDKGKYIWFKQGGSIEKFQNGGGTMSGDNGIAQTQKSRFDFNTFLEQMKKGAPSTIATARLIKNLRNNSQLVDLMKQKEAATASMMQRSRNTYGDFASLQQYENAGAKYNELADNIANSTSNQELAALSRFEGLAKANTASMQGRALDNQTITKTKEAANTVNDTVYDYNHKVADENNARFVAKHNADIDAEQSGKSANTTNIDTYLTGIENEIRTKNVDDESRKATLFAQLITEYKDNYVDNDPDVIKAKLAYLAETDLTKKSLLLKELRNAKLAALKSIKPKYDDLYHKYLIGDYDIKAIPSAPKDDFAVESDKYGGKIDSSKMKYRAEDLKELRKLVKHSIDTNRKALDNLSKATLLELKKMMGL